MVVNILSQHFDYFEKKKTVPLLKNGVLHLECHYLVPRGESYKKSRQEKDFNFNVENIE